MIALNTVVVAASAPFPPRRRRRSSSSSVAAFGNICRRRSRVRSFHHLPPLVLLLLLLLVASSHPRVAVKAFSSSSSRSITTTIRTAAPPPITLLASGRTRTSTTASSLTSAFPSSSSGGGVAGGTFGRRTRRRRSITTTSATTPNKKKEENSIVVAYATTTPSNNDDDDGSGSQQVDPFFPSVKEKKSSSSTSKTKTNNSNNSNDDQLDYFWNMAIKTVLDIFEKAIGSTTSLVVAGSFYGTICLKRDATTVCFFVGSILNAVAGKILKRVLKIRRPGVSKEKEEEKKKKEVLVSSQPKDHGMPSSHGMSLGFIGTVTSLLLMQHNNIPNNHNLLLLRPIVAIPSIIAYGLISLRYRVRTNLHTVNQIAVGAILGSIDGYGWYRLFLDNSGNIDAFNLVDRIRSIRWLFDPKSELLRPAALILPLIIGGAVVGSVERKQGLLDGALKVAMAVVASPFRLYGICSRFVHRVFFRSALNYTKRKKDDDDEDEYCTVNGIEYCR